MGLNQSVMTAPGLNVTQTVSRALDRLCDTTRVPLSYANGDCKGADAAVYTPVEGFDLHFTMAAKAFICSTHVASLMHVMGDLYMVTAFYAPMGTTMVFLIDRAKLDKDPQELVGVSMPFQDALDALSPGVVRSFTWKDKRWQGFQVAPTNPS